ncbi:hypothetical protein KRR26_12345 [Corallococcus sp. M34]|uniref:hypothetical protein n=1 Tax=Citreicoccus inhibens TaxID=2849499 RepID=UPI001C250EDD|nr:hypothetical protein [Citreicoccus inhibens]MBU8896403.1 hypothetical protein [Citreicoccus inhibens]
MVVSGLGVAVPARMGRFAPVRVLAACVALLVASAARAQSSEDRAYLGYTVSRGTSIGSTGWRIDERPQLELRLPLPAAFLGKLILLPSLGYEGHLLGVSQELGSGDTHSRSFHRIQLGLTLIRPLSPRWMVMGGVTGSTRTDFHSAFDPALDTSWAGYAMASYLIGGDPGMRLSFGLVALWPFDRTPIFPMVGFTYRKGPYLVELGVPRLTLMRTLGDGLELGLTGAFEQSVSHVQLEQAAGFGAVYVRETSLRFAPTANVRLGGNVWLGTSVGLDFLNDFALLDRDRKRLDLGALHTGPAPYVRLLLSWRPPRRMPATAGTPAPGLRPEPTLGAPRAGESSDTLR